jgi:competence protein ComEA
MGYRQKADLELARLISDRLALVLAEEPPRRARGPGVMQAGEPAGRFPDPVGAGGHAESRDERSKPIDDLVDELPRQRFGRMHLGVVCALLALGLMTAGWLLLRARPVAVASPGEVVTVATPMETAAPATPSTAKSASKIVVHVLGAVRRPGLVRLPENSRVQDAIEAAGGLTRRADPGELNLAQLLNDGQQVVIGTTGDPAGEVREQPGSGTGSDSTAIGTAVDLNRANQAQLEELPGIGPVTAQAILTWRQQHRRFSRVEELQEVDGIGPKTYAQIAPHVRV